MFIGGLPQGTTKELLNDFFVRYGPIEYTVIITEKATEKSRGFGFVIYKEEESMNIAMNDKMNHQILGKWVESKKANPKESKYEYNSQSKSKYKYSLIINEENSYKAPLYLTKEKVPQSDNLFIYTENDTNNGNILLNESPPSPNESHKTYKDYFINHIKDPMTYNYFQYKLFDINGEELSDLSPYQNNSKLNLFKSETESASSSTQTLTNKASSSSSSESEINLDANYKDLIENEHPYYGPRINKIIKNNFGSSFSPY